MLEPSDRLRNAIITGNLSITTRLLVRFPHLWLNVDPANNGWSNLHYASYHGHYLICFHLVSFLNHMGTFEENYSNLDLLSYDEVLVLHVPAFHHHAQTLHYLLQEFPGRIWRDSPGGPYRRTPLQTSCAEGFTEGVKLLLEFGADWRATDKNGDTCMHLAFQYGHFACAEVLLRFVVQESRGHRARDLVGVLEGARNHKGWVPVDYASSFALAKQYKALRKEVLNEDKEFNERVRDKNTRVQNAQDSRQKVKNYRGETADQVRGDTRNDDIDRRLGHKNLQSRLGLDIPETIDSDGRAIFDFNESESASSRSIGPSPTTAVAPSPLMDQPVTPTDPDPVRRAHSQSLPTSNPPDGFGRKPTSMSTSRKRSNTYNYRPPVLSNTGYLPRNSFGSPQTPGIRTPLLKSVTISPSMRKASEEAIEDDDDERKDRRKELGRFSNRSDGSLRAKEKEKKEALETFGLTYSSESPVNSSDHLGEAPKIRHMSITTPLEAAITERREEETEIGKVMEGGEKEAVQNESPSKIETVKENEETQDNNEVTKEKSNEVLKEKSNEALKEKSHEALKQNSNESLKAKSIESLKAKSIESLKVKSIESLRDKSNESFKAKSIESLKAKSNESLKENSKKTSRESLSKTEQSLPSPQKEIPGNQTPQLQQVLQSPRPGVAPVRSVSLQSSESSPEKARKNRLRAHVEVFTPGASRLGTPESDVRRAEEWPYVGQNSIGEDKLTSLRETTATKISPSASQSSSIAPSPNRVIGRGAEEVARLRRSSLSLSVARQVVFNSSRTSLANLESPNRRRPSLLNRSPSEETSPTLRKTQSSGTLPGALWKNASLPSGPYQLGNDSTESLKRTNVNSVSFNRLR